MRAVLPQIRGSEIERARRKRPEDLAAYGLTMRAFPFVFASNPTAAKQALDLLYQAIELEPDYAPATSLAAWCHVQLVLYNGTPSPAEERKNALLLSDGQASWTLMPQRSVPAPASPIFHQSSMPTAPGEMPNTVHTMAGRIGSCQGAHLAYPGT
jgi:hypothetical protein